MTAFLHAVGTAVPGHDVHTAFIDWARAQVDDRTRKLFDRMAARAGIAHRWSVLPVTPHGGSPVATGGFYDAAPLPGTAARMRVYADAAPALALAAIAALDIPAQLIQRGGRLRMTKQEVKDEHKESEGNPEVKGQQRARARAMLGKGARKAIAEAHVVLTNPTHFAVALRYDRGRDQVPVVVARGRGATALAIRELAAEATVPVLEYPQLARAVYYTSREGQEVRDDLYLAIATVLAFVFNVNAAAGGSPPPIDVPTGARFDENGVATA